MVRTDTNTSEVNQRLLSHEEPCGSHWRANGRLAIIKCIAMLSHEARVRALQSHVPRVRLMERGRVTVYARKSSVADVISSSPRTS